MVNCIVGMPTAKLTEVNQSWSSKYCGIKEAREACVRLINSTPKEEFIAKVGPRPHNIYCGIKSENGKPIGLVIRDSRSTLLYYYDFKTKPEWVSTPAGGEEKVLLKGMFSDGGFFALGDRYISKKKIDECKYFEE